MSRRRVPPTEKEQEFLSALASYRSTGEKQYRDIVFYRVQEVCYAVAKRILGEVRTKDFTGKVLDATCKVLARLDRNGVNDTPRKLSTFCYVYVLKAIYDPHIVNEEQQCRLSEDYSVNLVGSCVEQGEISEFNDEEN